MGELRFAASVARKLAQLGALTKGDRRGCSEGVDMTQFDKLLGIAEVLPPAPRRALPKASVDALFPPDPEAANDADSEEGDAMDEEADGGAEAAVATDGAAAQGDSSSSAAPKDKPS